MTDQLTGVARMAAGFDDEMRRDQEAREDPAGGCTPQDREVGEQLSRTAADLRTRNTTTKGSTR